MDLLRWVCLWWSGSCVLVGATVRRAGWLDRAVPYYRQRFLDDVKRTAPVQLRASLVRAPPALDEASVWNFAAVERLMALLAASDGTAPVRRALQRALRLSAPTRRFISKKHSYLIPSLDKNNIYYDSQEVSYEDHGGGVGVFDYDDDAVLVLDNPVEARLPAAQISVKLLRVILEARALAAREMPSTVKSSIPWIPMNKTSAGSKGGSNGKGGKDTSPESSNSAPAGPEGVPSGVADSAANSTDTADNSAANSDANPAANVASDLTTDSTDNPTKDPEVNSVTDATTEPSDLIEK